MQNYNNPSHAFERNAAELKSIPMNASANATVKKVVDSLESLGFCKNADVIDYSNLYRMRRDNKIGSQTCFGAVDQKTVDLAKSCSTDKKVNLTHNFESNGGFLVSDVNTLVDKVIQENYGQFDDSYLATVLPIASYPSSKVVVDVFAAPGGALDPYSYGTQAQEVAKIGNRTYEFAGIPWRNYLTIDESDATFWRDLGNPNTSARGLLQRMTMYTMQMRTIMNNRFNLLRSSLFINGTSYYGDTNAYTTVSYQIPAWNQVGSVQDPTNGWGSISASTYEVTPNNAVNPLYDLWFYIHAYKPWIGSLNKFKLVMSPVTEMLILQNTNVQSVLTAVQASPGSVIDPRGNRNVESILKTAIPGVECEVIIDRSAMLLTNSDVSWSTDGSGFTSTPPAKQYFIPPGKVLFVPDSDVVGTLGELALTSAIQNGGMMSASAGAWFTVEDLTAPGTRGGPANPSIQLTAGFAGGVKLDHPESTYIGTFATITA